MTNAEFNQRVDQLVEDVHAFELLWKANEWRWAHMIPRPNPLDGDPPIADIAEGGKG